MKNLFNKEPYKLDASTYYFDIECTPTKAWSYQNFDARVFEVEEDWHIQSFAYKKANESTIHCVALPDFPLYKKEPHNDREVVKALYEIFKKAHLLAGHNIDRFDIKKAKHRFMIHRLDPLPKLKTRDTFKMAKKFGFFSRSLDGCARELGYEGKEKIGAGELWKPCYNGDMEAWRLMKRYNKRDVEVQEWVDRRLVVWEENPPILNGNKDICPLCSGREFKRNGVKYGRGWEQQRYACIGCGFANKYGDKYKL